MQSERKAGCALFTRRISSIGIAAFATIGLVISGCAPATVNKHSVALEGAVAPVIDQAAAAYHNAEALYDIRQDYEAVAAFNDKQKVYNPRDIQPLLSEKDIDARLAVLAALQTYAKTLVAITNDTESPQAESAAKDLGGNLTSLTNTLAPSMETLLGIAAQPASTTETTVTTTTANSTSTTTSTSSTPAPVVSPAIENGISTGVAALIRFLSDKKLKTELPGIIQKMDPTVQSLCDLLAKDVDILANQQKRDYNFIINKQTDFLLDPKTKINDQIRREQIMKLPEIVRQEHLGAEQLATLKDSLQRLAMIHHALAADAQGNNPESLTQKLDDLKAAGDSLGKFYSSLSSPGK